MKLPQPFPYQGSKRNLAAAILAYVPFDCATFVEPFAGSAAMSIAVAHQKRARAFLINDFNRPLADLWSKIIAEPQALADLYTKIWRRQEVGRETDFYNKVRKEFNLNPTPDRLLFLLARCVKAAIRYNSRGEFNQSPDPRRRGMIPATMRGNLLATAALFRGRTQVCSLDYVDLCKRVGKKDVIYMDPPYQGVSRDRDTRYCAPVAYDSFVDALHEMNARRLSYLVSYDGRTGEKRYGEPLPKSLGLTHVELEAGRSSQATLLGRDEITVESLYLSEPLLRRLKGESKSITQLVLV